MRRAPNRYFAARRRRPPPERVRRRDEALLAALDPGEEGLDLGLAAVRLLLGLADPLLRELAVARVDLEEGLLAGLDGDRELGGPPLLDGELHLEVLDAERHLRAVRARPLQEPVEVLDVVGELLLADLVELHGLGLGRLDLPEQAPQVLERRLEGVAVVGEARLVALGRLLHGPAVALLHARHGLLEARELPPQRVVLEAQQLELRGVLVPHRDRGRNRSGTVKSREGDDAFPEN